MITKDMLIVDVLKIKPQAQQVFESYRMGCIHCWLAHNETIEQAAATHGVNLDDILSKLNSL